MLSFFRSIRQSLLAENKTLKYMKYAVGEFLLIVAGILMALQIQTWNENRKLEQDRRELIENLKADCETNLNRLDESIAHSAMTNEALLRFLKVATIDNSDIPISELRSLARHGFTGIPFDPSMGVYQSAQSTGLISLIHDVTLNELFIEFEAFNKRFQIIRDETRQDLFTGGGVVLRNKLGSLASLYDNPRYHKPEAFSLSDQQYRDFISQKEVYSQFENKQVMKRLQHDLLLELKTTTEQILDALEALE